jgi:hypothetical protein
MNKLTDFVEIGTHLISLKWFIFSWADMLQVQAEKHSTIKSNYKALASHQYLGQPFKGSISV